MASFVFPAGQRKFDEEVHKHTCWMFIDGDKVELPDGQHLPGCPAWVGRDARDDPPPEQSPRMMPLKPTNPLVVEPDPEEDWPVRKVKCPHCWKEVPKALNCENCGDKLA